MQRDERDSKNEQEIIRYRETAKTIDFLKSLNKGPTDACGVFFRKLLGIHRHIFSILCRMNFFF